jgi:type IV fimbrial biogenesis protein FimT
MKDNSGFTLMELMVVVAILAILSAIAVPNMIRWRNNAQFQGGIDTLTGDLAAAKQSTIRLNSNAIVSFTANDYTIFIDNGEGTPDADADGIPDGRGNGIEDGQELFINRMMPPGVTITIPTTFPGDTTRFDGRGRCPAAGTAVITDGTRQNTISINRLGRIGVI